MRKFFSSIWFRCIAVLVGISIVSGGLLGLLNDLLYVTPEERTSRAIKSIYGIEKEYEDLQKNFTFENYGEILQIYKIKGDTDSNFDYLFKSKGYNGYKNGTVTVWVQVNFDNGAYKINKVIYAEAEKQTLMSKFGNEYYEYFTEDFIDEIEQGKRFTPIKEADGIEHVMSGATKSANAVCNAVNAVIECYLGGNL